MFNQRSCAHHRDIGQKRGLFYDGRMKTIETYAEFWPFYLGEHDQAATRGWHYIGTALAIGVLIYACLLYTSDAADE